MHDVSDDIYDEGGVNTGPGDAAEDELSGITDPRFVGASGFRSGK